MEKNLVEPILGTAFVRDDTPPEISSDVINYTLSPDCRLSREVSCPVRLFHEIELHFYARGWDEVFPFNFRLTTDWAPPGVEMVLVPRLSADHSFGSSFTTSKSGYLTVQVNLPGDMVRFIEAWRDELTENEYLSVKFDVLAKKGTEWWLADPRLGVKP